MEEMHSRRKTMRGQGDVMGMCAGSTFNYIETQFPGDEGEYLIVSTTMSLQGNVYETGSGGEEGETFSCGFTVIEAAENYRPARTSAKPLIHGIQTAVVVGPAGEEIYTDEYSRIKAQFHWDREGKKNENSSCWMRVATPIAGKEWGLVHIPRIGQEVVVGFLEGDPDQPLVMGSVFNADQMPPYGLPANKTQSGFKTRSSMGGSASNCNELRFEDKKGREQVFLHAEKNQDIEVENNETHWVGNDRKKTIDHDETTHVKHDRTETVDNNETITINGNRTEKVIKDEETKIMGNRTETVMKNEDLKVLGTRTEVVTQGEDITIAASRTEKVGASESLTVGGSRSATIGASDSVTVAGAHSTKSAVSISEMGMSISMTAAGAITISAPSITLTGATINIVSPAVTISQRFVKPLIPPIIP